MQTLKIAGKILFSLTVFILFGELCARVANVDLILIKPILRSMDALPECHRVSPNPETMFELRPGSVAGAYFHHPIHINSFGMRDVEREKEKKAGVFRIVCIGASTVFGAEVDDNQTYPYYLESVLREKLGRPVEVWNAGVSGTVGRQQVGRAKEVLKQYSPDLLIFFCSNGGRRSIMASQPIGPFFRADPSLFWENVKFIPFPDTIGGAVLFDASYLWRSIVIAVNYLVTVPSNNASFDNDMPNQMALYDFCRQHKSEIPIFVISMLERHRVLPISSSGARTIPLFSKENIPAYCDQEYFEWHPPAHVYHWYAEVIAKSLISSGVFNRSMKKSPERKM